MTTREPAPNAGLALVQLPARMRRALKLFRKITGRTAVASVVTTVPESGTASAPSPPVHPRCAKSLRSIPAPPCADEWSAHLRASRRSSRMRVHTCPIGLRCSCVPIRFDGRLVGVAKLVVDAGTPDATFKTSLSVLSLVVSEACKDSAVEVLSEEVRLLRRVVSEFQNLRSSDRLRTHDSEAPLDASDTPRADTAGVALVNRAIAHLQRHFAEPSLSLRSVARVLDCNPKYLTNRFSRIVGEHMHAYLVTLRVSHACGLLVRGDQRVKEIAAASGFPRSARMTSAFRTHVGVSPSEYRRIFARP